MELITDWKGYHSLFHSKRKPQLGEKGNSNSNGPIYLVVHQNLIVSAYCETEDLSNWTGSTHEELAKTFSHREQVYFERSQVEEWLKESLVLSHYPDEIRFLRGQAQSHAGPKLPAKTSTSLSGKSFIKFSKSEIQPRSNFILEAAQSWWNKLIPSTYGVYLAIDDGRSLLLTIQRRQLVSFQIPDLNPLGATKEKQFPEVIRYLSERYLLPVQGFRLTKDEWNEWSHSTNPWRQIFKTFWNSREKVFPFKFGLMGLIGLRAYFHI